MSEKTQKRIDAAHALADLVQAGKDIKLQEARQAYLHDRIAAAVADVCETERGRQNHFTAAQIECLTSISFQIAYILDVSQTRKPGFVASVIEEWRAANWFKRIEVVGVVLAIMIAIGSFGAWVSGLIFVSDPSETNPVSSTLSAPTFVP